MTKNRSLIIDIIRQSEQHLDAQQIYELAKKRQPRIVMATVYNNLNALVREGSIGRVKVFGGPDRFDRSTLPHEHMLCDICGGMWDIPVADLTDTLEQKLGIQIMSYELNVHCICRECMKLKNENCAGGM